MKTFGTYTIVVVIILAVVFRIAWFYTPREHFVRVSLICYGYLFGWFSAWFANHLYSRKEPPGIARRHELSLNDSMKLGFLILLLSVSVTASKEIPNKSLTLKWDANRTSDKVTSYRVYEVVKSRRVLIGESKTPQFVIPRTKGKHVYVVTAVSAKGESAPSAPLQVQN